MPEKNFEQQVQHTLDELRVVPGGKVWQEVEASLKKDRRRRVIIFWLPLTGILLLMGIGTAVYFNQGKTNPDNTSKQVPVAIEQQTVHPQQPDASTTIAAKKEKPESLQGGSDSPKSAVPPAENTLPESASAQQSKPVTRKSLSLQSPDQVKEAFVFNTKKTRTKSAGAVREEAIPSTGPELSINPGVTELEELLKARSLPGYFMLSQLQQNDIPRPALPAAGATWLNAPDHVGPLRSLERNKISKWHWGIQVGAGRSGLSNGSLLSFSEKSLMLDNVAGQYAGNTPPVQAGRSVTAVSGVKNGTGWSAGLWASRSLYKRLTLYGGVEFTQYNTRQWIGEGFDSVYINPAGSGINILPGYYRSGDSVQFRNRYTYLELPLLLQWQLNPKAARPVTAEAGISFGYLLTAKAMNYYTATGAFFQETTGYSRFSTGLRLGVSLMPFRQWPLAVNPQLKWNLTGLRPAVAVPSHLWQVGLNLRYTLH